MNALLIAQYGAQLLTTLPALIQAGRDITVLVQEGSSKMTAMIAENREPTAEEWDALNRQIAALRSQLQK